MSALRCAMAIAFGVASATACSGTTEPEAPAPLSLALNQAQFGDLNNFSSFLTRFVLLPAFGMPAIDPTTCVRSSASGAFDCMPVKSTGGLTHALSYTIVDRVGAPMSGYDATLTEKVRAVVDVSGAELSFTAHHHSDVTIAGLLGGSRTIRGTSFDHDTSTSGGDLLITDAVGTARDVVFAPASSQYPTSGSLLTDVTSSVTQTGFPPLTSTTRYILTFTGGGGATTVEQFGLRIVKTCTVDLTGARMTSCSTP